jgi:hypothetical protein
MKNRTFLITLAVLTLGLLVPANVRAEGEPEPGVGRISVIHGDVTTMRGDSGSWVASTVNAPVVAGDAVATAARSRAEIQLDYANVLRLDQSAEAKIAALTRTKIQIQVSTGLVDFNIFKGTEADVEIDTPNMAVHPLAEGVYRIEVDSPTQTQVVVRQGEAEVSTAQGSTKVEKGQVIQVQGSDNPQYRIDPAQAKDDWDKWNYERDQQIAQAQAWQHTDRYYTGAGDLDANGRWDEVPGYDWCWTPYVDAGWVPYSNGSWMWEPYWGWTWVSYEPWGWAPYHYGRWFFYGGGWRWWPGVGFYGPRPVWAPAYVSFFGFGRGGIGVGFGFGFGSIGWLPLGPRDPFHPWWGAGRSFSVVNFTNGYGRGMPGGRPYGSNLENVMSNARVRGALTTVSAQNFANGRIAHNSQPVSESMLRGGSMVRGTLPVVPTRASLGQTVGNRAGFPSASANGQHFFSRSPAAAGGLGNFSAESNQVRAMVQRGPTTNTGQQGRFGSAGPRTEGQGTARAGANMANPATGSNPTMAERTAPATGEARTQMSGQRVGGATSAAPTYSWQRFPSRPAPSAGRTAGSQGQSGNWQHFTPQPRASTGTAGTARSFEQRSPGSSRWNAPAPRSGGSTYGWARPPLQLNRPIMRQRSGAGGSYGGGGRTYSAPSGGGHTNSAPRSGGGGGGAGGGHSRR